MRNDLQLSPWRIEHTAEGWHDDFLESIFFLGNGRMGVRGYLPFEPEQRPVQKGLYVAGIFGEIKPGITDFVNLPTPVCGMMKVDGEPAELASPIHRTLDLHSGVLTVDFTLRGAGKDIRVGYQRFLPLEHPALLAQRIAMESGAATQVTLQLGVMTASCNSPIPDDQVKTNTETVALAPLMSQEGNALQFSICGTDLTVRETVAFSQPFTALAKQDGAYTAAFSTAIPAGGSCQVDELACVLTSRDVDPRIAPMPQTWDYDALLREHQQAWQKKWDKCDMILPEQEDELRCALRFAMFQLIGSCSRSDPTVSIGARGLTHGRYKGCYFWDTDLFMLPFFLRNDPEAARNLCMYRVNALPAARCHAAEMNGAGARYPWMAALDGSEQCETWDIGCSEVHITADVAFALGQYCRLCGDEEFYLDHAAEVFAETARFWMSRYTWNADRTRADLLFCKGPDEYCGITNNNLYTNVMAQHNLELAIRASRQLREKRPMLWEKLGLSEDELDAWQTLHDAIRRPYDPATGRLTTDDTFHLLEEVDIRQLKPDDSASYHRVCFDRLQRYKVVKQADVLLLMSRLPELFTPEEKAAAWADFEPRCLHDSTLSFASHALFALQNGLREQGMAYLRKALLLDLRDVMGNTGNEGLHLANMGEAWQAAMLL